MQRKEKVSSLICSVTPACNSRQRNYFQNKPNPTSLCHIQVIWILPSWHLGAKKFNKLMRVSSPNNLQSVVLRDYMLSVTKNDRWPDIEIEKEVKLNLSLFYEMHSFWFSTCSWDNCFSKQEDSRRVVFWFQLHAGP